MTQELRIEQRGAALWLVIDRQERRNALNAAVLDGILAGFAQAEAAEDIRCLVLTAAGDAAFCSGADLQPGGPFDADASSVYTVFGRVLRTAHQFCKPIIARVNGACLAGGMGLLAMSDMAVAAPHAIFGLPEVRVGSFPMQVLSVLQPLITPRALAELSLGGAPISATEARVIGLINHVADPIDEKIDELVGRVTANSPTGIRRGLYALKRTRSMPFEEAMSFTESQFRLSTLTEDAREGLAAFREKRAPVWTGH